MVTTTELNAVTATINNLNLTGNFLWLNFNGFNQIAAVTTSLITPVSILSGSSTIIGGGVITGTTPNETFTFNLADAGWYEIELSWLTTAENTTTGDSIEITIDGVLETSAELSRGAPAFTYSAFNWRILRNLSASSHTIYPTFASTHNGTAVLIRDVVITVIRVFY